MLERSFKNEGQDLDAVVGMQAEFAILWRLDMRPIEQVGVDFALNRLVFV